MFEPDFSHLFTAHTDPGSGVVSHVLARRVAPVQLPFYFVNPSFSADARYLWFYCAFPPAPERSLGVVDFEHQRVTHDPRTGCKSGSPMIDPERAGVYWGTETAVWRRGVAADAPIECVGEIPADLVCNRHAFRCATHLTRSADGQRLLLDALIGDESVIGTLGLDGEYELWARTRDRHHNHGQFSPTDPDLALLAWDHATDPLTGKRTPYDDRLWLLRRGEALCPLFARPTRVTHEWWDADGRHVYFVGQPRPDMPSATYRVDVETTEIQPAWPEWHWHAHDWNHGQYLVGDRRRPDGFYRGCPSSVHFCNNDTGREIAIIIHNPEHLTIGRQYHIDPHPRFSPCGRFIVHATTVLGQVDLAVTPVAPLIERTGG